MDDAVTSAFEPAWRLALVVTGDEVSARTAVRSAMAAGPGWLGPPSAVEVLAAVYREAEALARAPGDPRPCTHGASAPPAAGPGPPGPGHGAPVWCLPPEDRVALWLVAEGHSPEEVGAVLEVAPTAVGHRCDRAAARAGSPPDELLAALDLPGSPPPGDLADLAVADRAVADRGLPERTGPELLAATTPAPGVAGLPARRHAAPSHRRPAHRRTRDSHAARGRLQVAVAASVLALLAGGVPAAAAMSSAPPAPTHPGRSVAAAHRAGR